MDGEISTGVTYAVASSPGEHLPDGTDWSEADARRLRQACAALGLKQQAACKALEAYGIKVGQQQLSRWMNGKAQPSADYRDALERFIEDSGVGAAPLGSPPALHLVDNQDREAEARSATGEVHEVALYRLKHGPPMSEWDYRTFRDLGGGHGAGDLPQVPSHEPPRNDEPES